MSAQTLLPPPLRRLHPVIDSGNLPRCDISDLLRPVCPHCLAAKVEWTPAEREWVAQAPPTHHLVPQVRRRRLHTYPVAQTWAGVQTPDDRPAGLVTCDADGHPHPDAFLCPACVTDLRRHLADVQPLVRDLCIAAAKDVQFPQRGSGQRRPHDDDNPDRDPAQPYTEEAPVLFNVAARAALDQMRDALPFPDQRMQARAQQEPMVWLPVAARTMLAGLADWLRQPDIAARAEAISRAMVHGRDVIDRPRDMTYYGVCPGCSADIYQERVDQHDPEARIVCPRGCGYSERYATHEQAALEAGEDRWLTLDELVGALERMPGQPVTRGQIRRFIEREGLPRQQRPTRLHLVGGTVESVPVDTYRLGDVLQMAEVEAAEARSLTSDQVAALLGVSQAAVRKMVERGELEPLRRGARPLRFDPDRLQEPTG